MKKISITAIIEKSQDGFYVGQLQEMPEVISQGKTLKELNENLIDALNLTIEARRETAAQAYKGRKTIKRKITFV